MEREVEKNGGEIEEDEGLGWGSSLHVPSVQELVRKDSHSVPERYIQELRDRPLYTHQSCLTSPEVPIISFSLLLNGDEDEQLKLDFACKQWGFFQIINHGVSKEVLKEVKAAVAKFFDLPLEEKRKYGMATNDVQGYGQGYVVSEQQKLDWGDLIFLMTFPSKHKKLKYWPLTIPGFKEAIEEYSTEIHKVTEKIFENLSSLMGMERDGLERLHGVMKQGMRMNYYPTCSRPDLVLGVSPHSDASSITLLLQDDHISGLQIRHKDTWIPVKPIPNALVVNIGDVIESWSNGVYKSVEHRAITNAAAARISIATFVIPEDEVELGPVETMADGGARTATYKRMKYVDYLRHTLARKMEGKTHTELLRVGAEEGS